MYEMHLPLLASGHLVAEPLTPLFPKQLESDRERQRVQTSSLFFSRALAWSLLPQLVARLFHSVLIQLILPQLQTEQTSLLLVSERRQLTIVQNPEQSVGETVVGYTPDYVWPARPVPVLSPSSAAKLGRGSGHPLTCRKSNAPHGQSLCSARLNNKFLFPVSVLEQNTSGLGSLTTTSSVIQNKVGANEKTN